MPLVRPPGPQPITRSPLALISHARTMGRDPTEVIAQRFERYGDLYHVRVLGRDVYVMRHPEHMHEVLVRAAGSFGKPREGLVARQLRRLLGNGLVLSDGELWRRQRRTIQPSFRRERLAQYAELVTQVADEFARSLVEGQTLDVSGAMMRLTLRMVSGALFGHDVSQDADRVKRASEAFRRLFRGASILVPPYVPTRKNRAVRAALRDMDALLESLLARPGRAGRTDLLSTLADAVDPEGGGAMDRRQLRDELMTLLFAGHDTTAHALSWTFQLVAQHPDVEARLREEALSVLGMRTPEPADLEHLLYTEQVLSEAMRLYPPAYVLARVTLAEVEVDGYTLPKGSDVMLWLYHTQRDARWFPEPLRFDPDRFAPTRRGAIPPLAYLPFGAGPRACIGKQLALMEAKLVLACTLRRVSLVDLSDGEARRDLAVTLAPRGPLPMRVQVL